MKILIDTNILISAALHPGSIPHQAYIKASSYPNHGLICQQNIDEMKQVFIKKFPDKLNSLNRFLNIALISLELAPIPTGETVREQAIRDLKDRPILRAAINAHADIILTGDKDFLESGLTHPQILTAADFLCLPNESTSQSFQQF